MQAFIAKSDLAIISVTRGVWKTPGEYTSAGFACIEFDCPDDMTISKVTKLGEASNHNPGEIYRSPSVDFEIMGDL